MATNILWNDRQCIHLSLLLFKCYFSVISSSFVRICCFSWQFAFLTSHANDHIFDQKTLNERTKKRATTNFTAITRRGHIVLLSLQMHVFHAPQSVYALFKVKHIILYEWLFGFPLSISLSHYFSCLVVFCVRDLFFCLLFLFLFWCVNIFIFNEWKNDGLGSKVYSILCDPMDAKPKQSYNVAVITVADTVSIYLTGSHYIIIKELWRDAIMQVYMI